MLEQKNRIPSGQLKSPRCKRQFFFNVYRGVDWPPWPTALRQPGDRPRFESSAPLAAPTDTRSTADRLRSLLVSDHSPQGNSDHFFGSKRLDGYARVNPGDLLTGTPTFFERGPEPGGRSPGPLPRRIPASFQVPVRCPYKS